MSRNLLDEMTSHALHGGGSVKTKRDRIQTMQRFHAFLRGNNIQIRHVGEIKARYIEAYIAERREHVGVGTLQNEMAHMRVTLEKAGKTKLAAHERLTNKALGASGRSREGTKTACPDDKYRAALAIVSSRDPGVAAAMQLQRVFGLRAQEAVRSVKSLKTWERQLADGRRTISVTYGTKGGRPRETLVLDRRQAIKTVRDALNIAKERGGKLIDKPDLKSALYRYTDMTRRAGLTGEHSNHSLRYAWARDCMRALESDGLSREEALAQTSQYLGHGEGRGRWLKSVYLR